MKLPVPVDGTLSASDLAPSPTELMLAAGGIAFENSADAATAYSKFWTPDAARQAAYRRSVTNPNKKLYIRVCHAPRFRRPSPCAGSSIRSPEGAGAGRWLGLIPRWCLIQPRP